MATLKHSADLPEWNSVGWYILEGYPWWPVYVCDPTKLRPNLHMLGNGHKNILKKAKEFSDHFAIVYYFGSHNFSSVPLKRGVLKKWDCEDRDLYLKGHPKHLVKKKQAMDELLEAIHEVEDYLSQAEDIRLPPCMVPSDLDPTLEPPPPVERNEEEEEEEEEGSEEEEAEEEEAEEEEDNGGADEDGEKKKETRKKKKTDTDDTMEGTKIKKEKTMKEKKRKESTNDKKKKESAKKKSEKEENKKRRRTDEEEGTPSKRVSKGVESESEADLARLLEIEIRWIFTNCQEEEMSTKAVRKILEKRLNRDLRSHKGAIKEAVTRVIGMMEAEEGGEESTGNEEKMEDEASAVAEDEENKAVAPVAVSPSEKDDTEEQEEPMETKTVEENKDELQQLTEATAALVAAGEDETKVLTVIQSLFSVEMPVESSLIVASGLVEVLKPWSEHHKPQAVITAVQSLAKQWKVEDVLISIRTIDVKEVEEMKKKLMDTELNHEELLACLKELEQMPLDISHLKATGIPRAVAALRQHANDKVSITAKNLRNAWMKLVDKDKVDNTHDRLKKLEAMNEILEQRPSSSTATEVTTAQLNVLEKLYKMTLGTTEIIDSKIGVSVSKLRKSEIPEIAKAAAKLRTKWKSLANTSA